MAKKSVLFNIFKDCPLFGTPFAILVNQIFIKFYEESIKIWIEKI